MLLNAQNKRLRIGDTDMDYIVFGRGKEALVVLPGLGDGLRTVKGAALPFAAAYRAFGADYRVYGFSRVNGLKRGASTRDMARDTLSAMDALGISRACLLGVSQGGMIAQHVAAAAPERVKKLVLAVTLARRSETLERVVGHWLALARAGDYRRIIIDTMEKSYSERYLRKYRPLYPLLVKLSKPRDPGRFITQAEACLGHDAWDCLARIACPTLIIGGGADRIVGPDAAAELAGKISGSALVIYEGLGHGAYEEAKDFNRRVLAFLSA